MSIDDLQPPLAATDWLVYRIVSSVYPPIPLFENVADPADLDAVYFIESLTNDRLRDQVGDLRLVDPADRVSGPGTSPIMAAFTHLNPHGARFTTPMFGAYYAATSLQTAIAETKYHRERFLAGEAPIEIDMRVYLADLSGELHDLRAVSDSYPEILKPDDYTAGQVLGRRLREEGSNGLIYPSVRDAEGTCVAVYRPRLLSNCRQERHLAYRWDGSSISHVYEKRDLP